MVDKRYEIALPEEVVEWCGWHDDEVPGRMREALVMALLRQHIISQGKAAELLGVTRHDLFELMTVHRVPVIDLTEDELQKELEQPFPQGDD